MKSAIRSQLTALAVALAVNMLVVDTSAFAQERQAYRVVDEKGNVTYSQTPPVQGGDVKKIDIAPAQRGRGWYEESQYSLSNTSRYYNNRQEYYAAANAARQRAQEQRLSELKTECQRQRGTDCDNPRALQYLDSTNIPGGALRRPVVRSPGG